MMRRRVCSGSQAVARFNFHGRSCLRSRQARSMPRTSARGCGRFELGPDGLHHQTAPLQCLTLPLLEPPDTQATHQAKAASSMDASDDEGPSLARHTAAGSAAAIESARMDLHARVEVSAAGWRDKALLPVRGYKSALLSINAKPDPTSSSRQLLLLLCNQLLLQLPFHCLRSTTSFLHASVRCSNMASCSCSSP